MCLTTENILERRLDTLDYKGATSFITTEDQFWKDLVKENLINLKERPA